MDMSTITCQDALAETFKMALNKKSWSKAGAVPHTRKRLASSKMRHDGTDKQDPNFNIFQDIQSQNGYSTTQLNIVGYKSDMLRAQFRPDKISERMALALVTVTNTLEHQEALAATHTHGKKFFVMGGKHVTSDDMFKGAELNRQTAEAVEREKDVKSRVEYYVRCKATLPIVNCLKNVLNFLDRYVRTEATYGS